MADIEVELKTPPFQHDTGPIKAYHESGMTSKEWARYQQAGIVKPPPGPTIAEQMAAKAAEIEAEAAGLPKPTWDEEQAKQEFKATLEAGGYDTSQLERQWEIEKKEVAETVGGLMPYGSTITGSQAQKAISYYEGIGQLGEAERVREYYSTYGQQPSEVKIERAADIGYGPFPTLREYDYNVAAAYAEGVIKDSDLNWLRDKGYLEQDTLDLIRTQGTVLGALTAGGYCEGGYCNLAGALAAGVVTEGEARGSGLFKSSDIDEAVSYQERFPYGIGAEVETPLERTESFWERFIHRESILGQKLWGPVEVPFSQTPEGQAQLKAEYEAYQDLSWMQKQWQYPFGGPGYDKKEERYIPAPIGGFGPMIIPAGGMAGVGITKIGQIALRSLKLSSIPQGAGFGTRFATRMANIVRIATVGTGATTLGGGIYGTVTPPPPIENLGVYSDIDPSRIGTTSSVENLNIYWRQEGNNLLMREGVDEAEAYRIAAQAGLQPVIGREVWERLPRNIQVYYTPTERPAMAYEPGLTGILGRGSLLYQKPIQRIYGWAEGKPGYIRYPAEWLGAGAIQYFAPLSITSQLWRQRGPSAYAAMIPHFGPTAITPFLAGAPAWQKTLGIGISLAPGLLPEVGYALRRIGTPKTHAPFPKDIVTYGPKGEVYIHLGKRYGWVPYTEALNIMRTDVAMARLYQPPTVFGQQPGFWTPRPESMVLRTYGRSRGPSLVEAGIRLKYPTLAIDLTKIPYYPPMGPTTGYPMGYYPNGRGPSPFIGTKPITGIRIFGEIPGTPPIQTVSLGDIRGTPIFGVSPESFSMGVRGHPGWAPGGVSTPPVSLEPYALLRGGIGLRGGIRIGAPIKPIVGIPSAYYPTTATMTQEAVASQLRALGLTMTEPSQVVGIPLPGGFPIPGITPTVVTPGIAGIPQVVPTPVPIGITIPSITPMPTPLPTPLPSPLVTPIPTPIPTPFITPTLVTTIPPQLPGPIPPPPPFWFPFGFPKLGDLPKKPSKKKRLLGTGIWKYRGFPVGGTHPITGQPVSYVWMGGREVPYGVRRKTLKTKPRKRTVGMVRLYRGSLGL